MKNIALTLSFLFSILFAQAQVKKYSTSSGELIFSFADYTINGQAINNPVRFTCFFHLGINQHFDFTDRIGMYTGGAIRNVGFTSTSGDSMVKRRNYYIGIPLAIKLGNLNKDTYIYGGVEGEFAIHYKEKTFVNEDKVSKVPVWFSEKTNPFLPSAFVGLNFKGGLNLKFKYYLKDFYNPNYTQGGVKIYENTTSQMFYFALSMNIRNSVYSNNSTYNKGL